MTTKTETKRTRGAADDPADLGPMPNLGYVQNTGAASVRVIHTTSNAPLRSALAAIPDYVNQVAALRELDKCSAPDAPEGAAENVLASRLAEALLGGGPAPDLTAQAVEIVDAIRTREVVTAAIARARDTLVLGLDELVHANLDQILSALDLRLQGLLDQARALAEEGPVSRLLSAESAFADDRSGSILSFHELSSKYGAVRLAQAQIMRVGDLERGAWPALTIFRSVRAVFPNFIPWQRHGYMLTRKDEQQRRLDPPWPHSANARGQVTTDAATAEFFGWAIDHQAALWVPTRAQLAEAEEAMQAAGREPDDGSSALMNPGTMPQPRSASRVVGR